MESIELLRALAEGKQLTKRYYDVFYDPFPEKPKMIFVHAIQNRFGGMVIRVQVLGEPYNLPHLQAQVLENILEFPAEWSISKSKL